jgi:hypothetical protein
MYGANLFSYHESEFHDRMQVLKASTIPERWHLGMLHAMTSTLVPGDDIGMTGE